MKIDVSNDKLYLDVVIWLSHGANVDPTSGTAVIAALCPSQPGVRYFHFCTKPIQPVPEQSFKEEIRDICLTFSHGFNSVWFYHKTMANI